MQPPMQQPTEQGPSKSKAIISMIFGIAAVSSGYAPFWAIPCLVLAIIAVVFSCQYRKACTEAKVAPSGMSTAGLICGIIGIVLSAIGLVCTVCTVLLI